MEILITFCWYAYCMDTNIQTLLEWPPLHLLTVRGGEGEEKNIYMRLFTKQEKHFYLDKKKPNSLSNPWCF